MWCLLPGVLVLCLALFHVAAQSKCLLSDRTTQWYSTIRTVHTYKVITVCHALSQALYLFLLIYCFLHYHPLRWVPSVLVCLQKKAEPETKASTHCFILGASPTKQGWAESEMRLGRGRGDWGSVIKWVATKEMDCSFSQNHPPRDRPQRAA